MNTEEGTGAAKPGPLLALCLCAALAIGCALLSLSQHGFVRGLFIGAALALLVCAGVCMGLLMHTRAAAPDADGVRPWLPSRDSDPR